MEGDVSRILAISPDSQYSPSYLARMASSMGREVFVKQTCYGILLEGKAEDVEHVIKELKKVDPNRIFSKLRGFPLGDTRRCRAQRGSARPGFYFLQKEIELLPNIAKGLECADVDLLEKEKACEKMDPKRLSEIIEEVVNENDKDNQ